MENFKKVPFKYISTGAVNEEDEHCGDGKVTQKRHEIVLDNLKKKPNH